MHTHGESLANRGDGEELIDTKVGGVHLTTKIYGPQKYASSIGNGPYPSDYAVKYLLLNGSMYTHGTKLSRER